ncbi:MAG: peptide deformylase [Anaerolineae bacterium]|nr:peptide deformylase [Anaerolineae bacterium]
MATVREIVTVESGNPVLREKARKVQKIDASLQTLIDDMVATMREAPGVGLAAPQVGAPLRVIVVEAPLDEDDPQSGKVYAIINPEIIKTSPEMEEGEEGCLSIPNWQGSVNRYVWVVVKGVDRQGREFRIRARDYVARIFQHEIDHLDGILFTDRVQDREKIWKIGERNRRQRFSEAVADETVLG